PPTVRVVGGQSRKMAKPILGRGLAVRCERSEHGKSQLFVKYLCILLFIISCHSFFRVSPQLSATLCLFASQSHCRSPIAYNAQIYACFPSVFLSEIS
ncbi:MAG: hypothetical protein FWD60_08500, partial [Candidatus Azobacteroides sp.]|nr:hypothetical protein [Candidatus Azobacteroides sp.]